MTLKKNIFMTKIFPVAAVTLAFLYGIAADHVEKWENAQKLYKDRKHAEALEAFTDLAQKTSDAMQKSEALRQAALCAALLKQYERAMNLSLSIPLVPFSKISQMEVMSQNRKYRELYEQFKDEDIGTWPASIRGSAFRLRGEAAQIRKDGHLAATDLEQAAAQLEDGYYRNRSLLNLGRVYKKLLMDEDRAMATFKRVVLSPAIPAQKYRADWEIADILLHREQPRQALELLEKVQMEKIGGDLPLLVWRTRAEAFAALDRKPEAMAAYREALKLEKVPPTVRNSLEKALESLMLEDTDSLVLAAQGRCEYQVVLPDVFQGADVEKYLQDTAILIRQAFATNGFEIVIVSENERDESRPALFLGNTSFARANGVDVSKFNDWRYVHKTVGRNIILAGHDHPNPVPLKPRQRPNAWRGLPRLGTMKAVTDFLRQYVGTRFLYPGETGLEFLKMPVIAIPLDLDLCYIPWQAYHCFYWGQARFYEIANGFFPTVGISLGSHTWPRAIPAATYRETNPEYFALINGQRCCEKKDHNGKWTEQYCISNPEVQELIYRDLLTQSDSGYTIVGLGQPDSFQPCQCDACRALFDTGNDWGEKIWILHRNLAERFTRTHPEHKVMIVSYGHTWEAPKTFKVFPRNVMVQLCRTTPQILAGWKECEVPGGFTAYTYTFLGGYTPTQTPLSLTGITKHLFETGVRGVYCDGFYGNYGLMGPAFYLYGRFFDDPANLNAAELLEEFLTAAFHDAAPQMRRFYDTLYHAVQFAVDFPKPYEDLYGRRRTYAQIDSLTKMAFIYSPDVIKELESKLDEAEGLSVSEKVERRLALVRLEFEYIRHIATVGQLNNAWQITRNNAVFNRLLDAVDDWNAFLNPLFMPPPNRYARSQPIPGWPEMPFFASHSHYLVALTKSGYAGNYTDSPLNWDTAEMRKTTVRPTVPQSADGDDGDIAARMADEEDRGAISTPAGDAVKASPPAPPRQPVQAGQ